MNKGFSITCLSAVSFISLSGCSHVDNVLKANFTQDVYQQAPDPLLPGTPMGDKMNVISQGNVIVTRWIAPAPNNDKATQITANAIGFSGLELLPSQASQGKKIQLLFNAYMPYGLNERDFIIVSRDQAFFENGVLQRLKLNQGEIQLERPDLAAIPIENNYQAQTLLTFSIHIDTEACDFDALILQGSKQLLNIENNSIRCPSSVSDITFDIGFDSGANAGFGIVKVNNILINRYD